MIRVKYDYESPKTTNAKHIPDGQTFIGSIGSDPHRLFVKVSYPKPCILALESMETGWEDGTGVWSMPTPDCGPDIIDYRPVDITITVTKEQKAPWEREV